MNFNTTEILMGLVILHLIYYVYFKANYIKDAHLLASDKEILRRYYNQNILLLMVLSFILVLLPFSIKFSENEYYLLYGTVLLISLFTNYFFSKKYQALTKSSKKIFAIQESNFNIKSQNRYKNRKYLNIIEKNKIKSNNHFKFSVRRDDLTIEKIRLNKEYVNFEYENFKKVLQRKKINPHKNILYKKLIIYINKNLEYIGLEKLRAKNDEVSLLVIQLKIFEKVQILNQQNVNIKLGQLFSIANDTFDMQFLSFIDALKTKKYNNDSLMYGILFIEGKKL